MAKNLFGLKSMIQPRCLLVLLLVLGLAAEAQAQQNRLLPTDDWAYGVITRLQRRGHLLDLNPTALPYRHGDVLAALAKIDRTQLNRTEQHWVDLLDRAFKPVEREDDEVVLGYMFQAGARTINSDRIDVVRPLGDTLNFFWYGTLAQVYAESGPLIAEVGFWQNKYYDVDPDGLDTALRLLIRSENTYVGYHSRLFSAYLGRWSNHWGVSGEAATLVSDNPRSQDQVSLRLGGETFSITGLLSELDSITEDGRFTGRVGDDSVRVGNKRRYLAAHRWDFRPSRRFMLTAMESALYSGDNAGVSLKYLNPLHPFTFVVDNIPKNDENNGFVTGLIWAQLKRLTLHGQLMVDDVDSRGESGLESFTYAFSGSAVYAASSFDLGATLEVVTARAYNAPQPEGSYIYLLRGLGTQFSDYVHASAFADVYLDGLVPGLRVTPRLHLLAQGERDIRQPFPASDEVLDNLLDGTVARTMRPAVQVYFQRDPWWWIGLDAGVNVMTNIDHVEGQDETRFIGMIEVGLRLRLDGAVGLSFP